MAQRIPAGGGGEEHQMSNEHQVDVEALQAQQAEEEALEDQELDELEAEEGLPPGKAT
jgi:hypothetical protein